MYAKALSTSDTISMLSELTGTIKTLRAKKFSFLFVTEKANNFFI